VYYEGNTAPFGERIAQQNPLSALHGIELSEIPLT